MRIYCVDTLPRMCADDPGAALAELQPQLARAAALGFSHLLLAPAAAACYRAPAARLEAAQDQRLGHLAQLSAACRAQGLALLFDLAMAPTLDALATGGEGDAAWQTELHALVAHGVDGFRAVAPASLPAARWTGLLAAVRAQAGRPVLFMAWTPGLTPAQLQALAGCGFDAVFSSLPWWDFRSVWLADEQQRLRALGAHVIQPLADLLVREPRAFAADPAAARRWLSCAAFCGDGLLMPAGFELGGAQAYDLSAQVRQANAWLAHHAPAHQPGADALRVLSGAAAPITVLTRTLPPALKTAMPELKTATPDAASVASATARPSRARASASAAAAASPAAPAAAPSSSSTSAALAERATAPIPVAPSAATIVIAINRSLSVPASYPCAGVLASLAPRTGAAALLDLLADPAEAASAGAVRHDAWDTLDLEPGAVHLYEAGPAPHVSVRRSAASTRTALSTALQAPRIIIENVQPTCDAGRFAVRRVVGECVSVEADVWMDGHDLLGVAVCWRPAGTSTWQEAAMLPLGNDRWRGVFALERLGRYEFTVQAWHDPFSTWLSEFGKKRAAGLALHLETEEGRLLAQQLIADALARPGVRAAQVRALQQLAQALAEPLHLQAEPAAREAQMQALLQHLLDPNTQATLAAGGVRPFLVRQEPGYLIEAERLAARYGSWYELFPRSQSNDTARHGTFDDVIAQLPRIAAMGFDVLYFPPIHPIGQRHRKGRNNSLNAGPDEPGSPYAIGAAEGGHEALHPQLGGFDDFRRLLAAAATQGLEIALDFAVQCAPDHPWLREHPEWFSYRPDGTVRHAENPPKLYQDIVNVDFYAEAGAATLWPALRDIVLFWASHGVRIFRVDNPHTKPAPFWEWLIAEVRAQHPDAIFLAEAFTRPKPMARLAKLGFSQSYTYFTWRNDKRELTSYMTELTQTPLREYFRPHFFVNTPDINPYFLHDSGRAGFLIRAALASLLSGLWGMLSGFELCEAQPLVVNGQVKEEYLDSEKFELRPRDYQQPGNIVAQITRLNALRRNYPALQHHLGVQFYAAANDQVLYFARYTEPLRTPLSPVVAAAGHAPLPAASTPRFGDSVLLVAINLDPFNTQQTSIEVPLWEWGLPDNATVQVEDLMQGYRFEWQGKVQNITLQPQQLPFAVWEVTPMRDPPAPTLGSSSDLRPEGP